MNVRIVARWLAAVTLVGAGITMLRELAGWEWHRALVAGTFTLVAEVALATSLILDRLPPRGARGVATAPCAGGDVRREDRFAAHFGASRQLPDRFAWLRDPARMNVFVPLLMGAGVLLSGLAWLVERIAARTTGRYADRRLARRLLRSLPTPGPLVPQPARLDHPALVPLLAPRPRQGP